MKRDIPMKYFGVIFYMGWAAFCVGEESIPSVSSLLDKYTQTLDSTSSFINQFDNTTKFSYRLQSGSSAKGECFERGEVRHDNQRLYYQTSIWGDFNSQQMDLPESESQYSCKIISQDMYYQNSKHIGHNSGSAAWRARPDGEQVVFSKTAGISHLLGYVGSEERLDKVLRNSENVSVRGTTEIINGSTCYVIEADTRYGHYKIWLDSEHGWQPAKILHTAKEGDYLHNHLLNKGNTVKAYLQNVRFEQVDGVWVPVAAESGSHNDTPEGWFTKEDTRYQRINVILNPDHEKLGSFADPLHENPANDPELQDGTLVRMVGLPISYLWQDGKLIPNIDREAVHQIDTLTESILSKDKVEDASVTLAVILAGYKKTQDSLAAFYCEGQADGENSEPRQAQYAGDGRRFSFKLLTDGKAVDTGCVYDGTTSLVKRGEAISACADPNQSYALLAARYPGAPLLGYLNGRTERIDTILQKALTTATVTGDPIDAKKCFRVTASIGKDTYQVWFAPFYGYQILKAQIESGNQSIYSLDDVEFREIESHWVPAACRVKQADGRAYTYRRSRVELNPDFTALEAFELPVADGTSVQVEGKPGTFLWKDGRVTDQEGNHVF